MREVSPTVSIIARTMPDDDAITVYLEGIGANDFARRARYDAPEDLVEFAGRMCYRSWEPGLNKNIQRTRADQGQYIENILKQEHGSVLEHVTWTFVLQDISRIVTHELVRHRVGVAISQESMRYVRLTDLPMWFPSWALEDRAMMEKARLLLWQMEEFQHWAAQHYGLDDPTSNFTHKKRITSFMRRLAPGGHATSMTWTANTRTLRHVIETRTACGAEDEIRMVFGMVAQMMVHEHPMLFGDFEEQDDGCWVPQWRKV